jgi:predicted amidophosphoribosyltransferase
MKKRFSLAKLFTPLLAETISARWAGWSIVPVPPRAEKLRSREWDQVEELVRGLERMGFQILRLLWRRPSREQKSLDKADRGCNARQAYTLKAEKATQVKGRSLLLIDDVCTTGATLEACAEQLLSAGAIHVAAIVIATD